MSRKAKPVSDTKEHKTIPSDKLTQDVATPRKRSRQLTSERREDEPAELESKPRKYVHKV